MKLFFFLLPLVASAAIDPANWMGALPSSKVTAPLMLLSIPGSHDSFTETLEKDGPIANDEKYAVILKNLENNEICQKILQTLEDLLGDGLNQVLLNWSRTQEFNVTQQLNAGIRYVGDGNSFFKISRQPTVLVRHCRYFDFRLSHPDKPSSVDDVRIVHGLYGDSVWNIGLID